MQTFIVPTTFTASDKYSKTLDYMGAKTKSFASGLHSTATASESLFRKLTPGLSDVSKQFLSVASTAAITAGVIAGGRWSIDEIMKYEDELANLQAVTGATDAQFGVFKKNINQVASETKKSSVEVAQAFTAIANNQPELLKDADALGMVVKQSILLAKAAKIDLQPAGEAVTQVLNQYGKGAEYAAKLVNVLASGSVAGSSEIRDTAEAIKQFGTVAATAGVQIDESVALIELGSKFDKGAEAGVKFRNILLNMTGAKVLDKLALRDLKKAGVNLDIVSSKTLPLNTRLLEMSKIAKDTNAIMHVFGKENAAMAAGVLTNAGAFAEMQMKVNTIGEAERMAAKNSDTLRNKIEEAKASFVTYLTSSDNLSSGLNQAKSIMGYVATHIDDIVSAGINLIKFFALWKAANVALNLSTKLLSATNTAFYIVDMVKYVAATQGMTFSTAAWTVAQESLNAAILANPLGAFLITIGLVAVALYGVNKAIEAFDEPLNKSFERQEQLRQEAFKVQDLRDKYLGLGKSLKEAEALALQGSKITTITQAKEARQKLESLDPEVRQQGVDDMFQIQQKAERFKKGDMFTKDIGQRFANSMDTKSFVPQLAQTEMATSKDWLNMKPSVSTKVAQSESNVNVNNTNKNELKVTFANPTELGAKVEGENKSISMLPNTTSTVTLQSAK